MKLLAALIFTAITFPAFGEDLYKIGREAYVKNDYVTALKYLFAYRTLKEKELLQQPDFLLKLDSNIKFAETQLQLLQLQRAVNTVERDSHVVAAGGGAPITDNSSTTNAKGMEIRKFTNSTPR